MKLGNNIKQLRKKHDITQTILADKLGVTEQTVSKWENDKCYPDVSLLPLLANVFGCSVDALIGIQGETYGIGIQKVLEKYEQCSDYNEEIEILLEGLTKFPNNNELKFKLAHAYFMAWRMSEVKEEKYEFLNRAVNYCNSVVLCSQNDADSDRANDLLIQIYAENGDYEKALQTCDKLSVESWKNRIVGIAQILRESNSSDFSKYAQNTLFELQTAMRFICELYYNSLIENKDYAKALLFCELQEKILSLFDNGSSELYICEKMLLAFQFANIYKKKSQSNEAYDSLLKMCDFAKIQITKGGEHSFSENSLLGYVNEKQPYMSESETKKFINTFLDKFVDVFKMDQLNELKI